MAQKRATQSAPTRQSAAEVLARLERMGSEKIRLGMARFAIPSDNAFGISVGDLRKFAKSIGRDHELAQQLWQTPNYEARMIAIFIDDPQLVTAQQMNRWCGEFDNWAICDTACFHLFSKTAHAWKMIPQWAKRKPEFERRAAFAQLASMCVHDKAATDEPFAQSLALIVKHASDSRNFVKKAVNWALRCIGKRNSRLHALATATAESLASSDDPTARWIGKDALREFQKPNIIARIKKRTKKA